MPSGDFPIFTDNTMATHTHSLSNYNHSHVDDKSYYYGSSCDCGCGMGRDVHIGGFVEQTQTVAPLTWSPLGPKCAACRIDGASFCAPDGLNYCLPCWGKKWWPAVGDQLQGIGIDPELEKLKPELEKLRAEFNKIKEELRAAEDTIKFYDEVTVYSLECDKDNLAKRLEVSKDWNVWYSDNNEHLQGQISQLAEFITTEVPGEPSQSEGAVDTAIRIIRELQEKKAGIEEGDLVQDVSQNKGPYYAIRETLVDIVTSNRTHRMPGWVLKDSKGKHLELPTSVLDHHQPSEPIPTSSLTFSRVLAISVDLAIVALFLYSLLINILTIVQ